MCTVGTLKAGLYKKECEKRGITLIEPDEETENIIMDIIYNQIKKGKKGNIDDFNKIENFVKSQSEEYRHGLEIYKREDLLKMMEFWREMKISALGY